MGQSEDHEKIGIDCHIPSAFKVDCHGKKTATSCLISPCPTDVHVNYLV